MMVLKILEICGLSGVKKNLEIETDAPGKCHSRGITLQGLF